MKIISKFRDYYDHEVGNFGFDDSRVYDRRAFPVYSNPFQHHIFAICGVVVPVLFKNGKFYFDKSPELDYWDRNFFSCKGELTNINQIYKQPVLSLKEAFHKKIKLPPEIPILANFGFPGVMSSREMYSQIYDFLGWLKDNPPPPDNQNDKQKIVSHGFDLSKSFRPKIKC